MQKIGAHHFPILLSQEYLVVLLLPVGERLIAGHFPGKSVSLSVTNCGLDDLPNCISIGDAGGPDGYHGTNIADDEPRIYATRLSDLDDRGLSWRADGTGRWRSGNARAHVAVGRRYPLCHRREPGVGDRDLFRRCCRLRP